MIKKMNYNEQLGIKSIGDFNKEGLGKKLLNRFKEQMSLGWIFEKLYEKFILIILCLLGLWKIFDFF